MAQITIYLDDDVLAQIKVVAKGEGVSKSQWISDAIRLRMNQEWPQTVRELAGAWPDFPSLKEIREQQGTDVPRERL